DRVNASIQQLALFPSPLARLGEAERIDRAQAHGARPAAEHVSEEPCLGAVLFADLKIEAVTVAMPATFQRGHPPCIQPSSHLPPPRPTHKSSLEWSRLIRNALVRKRRAGAGFPTTFWNALENPGPLAGGILLRLLTVAADDVAPPGQHHRLALVVDLFAAL